MKKVIVVALLATTVLTPIIALAQAVPQPPHVASSSLPDLQSLTNGVAWLGMLVYTHPLTALFVVAALALFAALPEFVSASIVLLLLAVAVYLWGH